MPYRRLPNTDRARIRALKMAIESCVQGGVYTNTLKHNTYSVAKTMLEKFSRSVDVYNRCVAEQSSKRSNAKYEAGKHCSTPHLYEDDLKQHFITALSQLLTDRTALLEDGRLIRSELLDFTAIDTECDGILQELDVVAGMIRQMVNENATQVKSQAAYIGQYNSLVERYENLQSRYDTLQQQKERRQIQADAIGGCLFALEELDLLQITFSDALWNTVIDHVTVYVDDRLVFRFKNGSEILVQK